MPKSESRRNGEESANDSATANPKLNSRLEILFIDRRSMRVLT